MPSGIYVRTEWHYKRLIETRRRGFKHTKKTIDKMRKTRLNNPIKSVGKNNYFWKNGKYTTHGYVMIWNPDHPYSTKDGYVREHRLIMEKHLGRFLNKNEIVHHINGKRNDNRLENLKLFIKKEHDRFHTTERHKTIPRF